MVDAAEPVGEWEGRSQGSQFPTQDGRLGRWIALWNCHLPSSDETWSPIQCRIGHLQAPKDGDRPGAGGLLTGLARGGREGWVGLVRLVTRTAAPGALLSQQANRDGG